MSDTVSFYYNPMSRGRIVHWMLEEVGAPYEIKSLDWKKAEHKSPEYLKINPMGKIPAIVHKGTVVTETGAICLYLADAFPKMGLAPALNDPARGTYYRWLFFATNCFEPAMVDKKNPRVQKIEPSHTSYGTHENMLKTFEKAISNGFILGDKFSAADVYISSLIGWALMQKDIELTPVIEKYQKLCQQRPAFKKFTEQVGALG